MQSKSLIWLGFFIGSAVGSYVPLLWGGSVFSLSSIALSGLGGLIGIYIFYRLGSY